ncbi:signal peptidase II [Lactobacillus taiwanensis]|uniref:signal peptidase II n=1 Tax=Lactobacillus taiwanensis TaxID=508451 RepID=UPI001AEC62B8|nr:signal peptidase II [Lactobacillus taiwanensis]QTQ39161.1 signal peptidase II [Lactobacillus taiwanensis]
MNKAKQALYLIISLLVVIADQVLKSYIVSNFKIGEEKTVIPGILSFTYLQNDGAAWNIFNGQIVLFYLISIAAIAVVIYYLFNPRYKNGLFDTGLALVLGGIIGNFIDRLHLKYVIDMLQLDFINFNIFNVADSAITIGIILVFIYLIFISEKD